MNTPPIPPSVEILIAEDSPTQARRLEYILEKQGYRVTRAENGVRGLELARRSKPTLIISDVVMPEMDGYEFCREVKADPALADIPLILVTALSDPQDVIRGLECGAENFILKPYEAQFLLNRVQVVLLNRDVQQPERPGQPVEVFFNGQKHSIAASRLQIVNLLLSTYEAAIEKNRELNRAQEELRRVNERLQGANSELESFSYSVSHDLRAPLRHIGGFAALLDASTAGRLNEKEKSYLKNITEAVGRMGRLIEDLLEFSRMGRAEFNEMEIDPNVLVRESIASLEPETAGRQITWKIGVLPRVNGDRALLRQVLINLVSNAVKYSRERPVAEISIDATETESEVVVSVRDNGAGFDMKFADKLFGVFQRLHRADQFEGTGIGLANVRRIVARHGGRTWAESKLGEGATFYFSLPKLRSAG